MRKAVLDTNVIVSSIISKKGAPCLLTHAWREARFTLITSDNIIKEVQRVLLKPELKETFHFTEAHIFRFVETLRKDAVFVSGQANVHGAIPNDPSDEMFLAAALDAKADYIVSGDKRLLALGNFKNISILTPRQFLELLESES